MIRRFNEFKKPIFRDEPPKPQSPSTDPVIDNIVGDTFFTPPHSPVEDVLKPDLKPPLTNFNKDTNIIEMIPKSIKKEPDNKIALSDQLSKLFPQVNDEGKIPEHEGENITSLPIDKLVEILTKTDKGQIPEVLEFFSGGKNKSFDQKAKMLGVSSNSLDFLDFLQSAEHEEILVQNKLKIHVESGNIFHNNIDTNESIYSFFQPQEDSSKAFINFDFIFGVSYCDYFEWLINKFKAKKDDKYDVLTNKKSKYLFYKFNDSFATIGELVKAVCHSKITQGDAAVDAIQNQNWQYLVETLLYDCSKGENLISFDENNKKVRSLLTLYKT